MLGEAPNSADTVGVGVFSNPSVNAVTGVVGTDLPAGASITINLNGAFFSSGASTGMPVVTGGTAEAQVRILLHELAHATGAADFRSGDQGKGDQDYNNGLVSQHCQKTIDGFK
jgi:hypothetical protein